MRCWAAASTSSSRGVDGARGVPHPFAVGQGDRALEYVEGGPRIAAGEVDQVPERVVGEGDAAARSELAGQSPLGVLDRPPDDGPDIVVRERLEAPDPHPREEGAVHLEVRVLRRRPDEGDRAVLDVGEEGVLLGLVEAMDLVEEEDGPGAVQSRSLLGAGDDRPDVGDSAHDRRQRLEVGPDRGGEEAGEARLAGPRRTPQEDRGEVAPLHGAAQRSALTDEVLLTDELVEGPWPHPGGQRLPAGRRPEERVGPGAGGSGRWTPRGHCPMVARAGCPLGRDPEAAWVCTPADTGPRCPAGGRQATLARGVQRRGIGRSVPGSGASGTTRSPSTKATTRRGSSWVSAASSSRLMASSTASALR